MAETIIRPGLPRARIRVRYLALRGVPQPKADRGSSLLTARAGRFLGARSGCRMTLAELASLPEWDLEPNLDRDRLASLAGLVAAAPALMLALDGASLRRLADHFGEATVDRVLDTCADIAEGKDEAAPATVREVNERGAQVLAEAKAGSRDSRTICERAWLLYREQHTAS